MSDHLTAKAPLRWSDGGGNIMADVKDESVMRNKICYQLKVNGALLPLSNRLLAVLTINLFRISMFSITSVIE